MQQPAATKSPQTQTKTGGRCITFAVLYMLKQWFMSDY